MAAAKLLIDRVIPSRRGAPVSFHIRPLKMPEDCALAYADLLDNVGAGRLTPDEAQTISSIVAKRAELFPSIELAAEIEALKAQPGRLNIRLLGSRIFLHEPWLQRLQLAAACDVQNDDAILLPPQEDAVFPANS